MKRLHRGVFEEIDWSTELVLSQTIERANQIGAAVHLLPTWYDVDDRATLRRLCDEIFGSNGRVPVGGEAPHTRAFLERILAAEGRERIWPNE
jgi:hypothetical protein